MHETCKTVKIKTENGPVIINEDDFDESTHELWKDEQDGPETKNDYIGLIDKANEQLSDEEKIVYDKGLKKADIVKIYEDAVAEGKIKPE